MKLCEIKKGHKMFTKQELCKMWRKMEMLAIDIQHHAAWPGERAFYEGFIGFTSYNEYLNLCEEVGYFDLPLPAHCKGI